MSESLSLSTETPRFAPLEVKPAQWQRWLAIGLSLLFFGAVAAQLDLDGFARLRALVPVSPAFWLAFAAYYLAAPISEWLIFRRLWQLPFSGLAALVRKFISNELLLGYSGEVYFYSWVRQRAGITGTPFGAIKDMAITSALAGNVITLVMLPFAWPALRTMPLGNYGNAMLISIGVLMAISTAALLFGRRIFALPPKELILMTATHLARVIATTGLLALLWHLALPTVPLALWGLLAALRLLISRLPFLPNKDALFAAISALLVGQGGDVATLMAMMAALLLATHAGVGAILGAADLVEVRNK